MTQVLNLKENELDILARFLGHDIRVHREYYRLPDQTLQVAKVAKLLIAMEDGQPGIQMGQTLDDIVINPNEGKCTPPMCIYYDMYGDSCVLKQY